MINFLRNPLDLMEITSPFGYRTHPVTGIKNTFHNGIDLRAKIGTPLYAVANGKVVQSKVNNGGASVGLGYYIVIQHDGFCTVYAHMEALSLPIDTQVKSGQIIGYSGASGAIAGAHLHFEVRNGNYSSYFWNKMPSGQYVNSTDPEKYIIKETIDMNEQNTSEWAKEARDSLMKLGITDGTDPKGLATREEIWTMIDRALKVK